MVFNLVEKLAWIMNEPVRVAIFVNRTIRIFVFWLLTSCSSSEQVDVTEPGIEIPTDKINAKSESPKYLGSPMMLCADRFSEAHGALPAEDVPKTAFLYYPDGKASQQNAWCFPQGTL